MADDRRTRRVAETIRAYLGSALMSDLGDAALSTLVVTRVEVPADLSVAWVYIRALSVGSDTAERARVMQRLARASARLRRGMGPRLRLRRLPELRFQYDDGQEAAWRVSEILQEIAEEQKSLAPDSAQETGDRGPDER